MRIFVKFKSAAKEERIEKIDDANFIVAVKEPPREGRANAAITRTLAEYKAKIKCNRYQPNL